MCSSFHNCLLRNLTFRCTLTLFVIRNNKHAHCLLCLKYPCSLHVVFSTPTSSVCIGYPESSIWSQSNHCIHAQLWLRPRLHPRCIGPLWDMGIYIWSLHHTLAYPGIDIILTSYITPLCVGHDYLPVFWNCHPYVSGRNSWWILPYYHFICVVIFSFSYMRCYYCSPSSSFCDKFIQTCYLMFLIQYVYQTGLTSRISHSFFVVSLLPFSLS